MWIIKVYRIAEMILTEVFDQIKLAKRKPRVRFDVRWFLKLIIWEISRNFFFFGTVLFVQNNLLLYRKQSPQTATLWYHHHRSIFILCQLVFGREKVWIPTGWFLLFKGILCYFCKLFPHESPVKIRKYIFY